MATSLTTGQRRERLLVALGFLALGAAAGLAYTAPATGYETSIYAGTPLGFWIGFGLALAVGVGLALTTRARHVRSLSLVLSTGAVATFLSLPVVRGYYFFGSADSLTHLGWIRDVATGRLQPVDLFYPGLHTVSALVHQVTGFRLERAALLAALSFAVAYVLFVTLCVRALTDSEYGTAIGAVSAFLLLPINLVVVQLTPHSISQTSLFFALVLFLLVKYLPDADGFAADRMAGLSTDVGVVFVAALAALVLYHPQGAVTVLVLFGAISAVQFLSRRFFANGRIASYRPLYAPTLFLLVWLLVWIVAGHQGLFDQGARILEQIVAFLQGQGGETGAVVAERGTSLQSLGAGLFEIFLKLFFVTAVYVVLAGVVMLAGLFGALRTYPDTNAVAKLLAFGFAVLVPWTLLQFVGDLSTIFFRYLAFIMVVVTVLGAFGMYYVAAGRRREESPETWSHRDATSSVLRAGLAFALAGMLVVSLATAFPSAFVYQPSGHVTEAQLDGYEATFDRRAEGHALATTGFGSWRYRHAVSGTAGNAWSSDRVPRPEYDHDLRGYMLSRSGGQYLLVTEFDRVRATQIYRGLRYDRSDFRAVQTQPGIDRVQSNGEVDLYLYEPPEQESGTTDAAGRTTSADDGAAPAMAGPATASQGVER